MALDTFANLKTEITDHLDRDDLTTKVETFITLAEARHKREIRIREMLRRSQTSISSRFVSLPDQNFAQMLTLRLLTDPVTVLEELNFDMMNRRRKETNGTPKYFTIHEEIEFDVTPDSAITGEMIYYATFNALSSSNPTNPLLTRAPDVYLYGALAASAPYLMNDERLQLWNSMYANARDSLNDDDRRSRTSTATAARIVGSTP